jgi:hypothetical protein
MKPNIYRILMSLLGFAVALPNLQSAKFSIETIELWALDVLLGMNARGFSKVVFRQAEAVPPNFFLPAS